jgi:hypothetical protein
MLFLTKLNKTREKFDLYQEEHFLKEKNVLYKNYFIMKARQPFIDIICFGSGIINGEISNLMRPNRNNYLNSNKSITMQIRTERKE